MICDIGRMAELLHATTLLHVHALTFDYTGLEHHPLGDVQCMRSANMGGVLGTVVGHRGTNTEEQAAT